MGLLCGSAMKMVGLEFGLTWIMKVLGLEVGVGEGVEVVGLWLRWWWWWGFRLVLVGYGFVLNCVLGCGGCGGDCWLLAAMWWLLIVFDEL